MKAVVRFSDPAKGCKLLDNVPVPVPPAEHVQIKVMASPVNPCDEGFCSGKYAPHGKVEPFACGYEGSGIITQIGEGVPKDYLNKRVAFYRALKYTDSSFGVWCQYCVLHYNCCVILDDSMPFEETSGLLINPLTIFGFLEIMKRDGHKIMIHTAAASGLGKMLIGVCKAEGLGLICVVRREEQRKSLEALGATLILNQKDPNFVKDLKKLSTELDCRIAFDAVGGDLTASLLAGMPGKSTVYMYGSLGGAYTGLTPSHFMCTDQTLKGFVLSTTEVMKSREKLQAAAEFILADMRKGSLTFKINVVKRYKLEQFNEALAEYKSYATEGKGIIIPN